MSSNDAVGLLVADIYRSFAERRNLLTLALNYKKSTAGSSFVPFLFALAIRKIGYQLPEDVKIIMYADDIILYIEGEDIAQTMERLEQAFLNVLG